MNTFRYLLPVCVVIFLATAFASYVYMEGGNRSSFVALREQAAKLDAGMNKFQVVTTMGIPGNSGSDGEFCFFVRRSQAKRAYVVVRFNAKSEVKNVDIIDWIYDTCSGKNYHSCDHSFNGKTDRIVVPAIIGA